MATRHDPELEQFKRSIDLVEYAKKTGYEPRPNDGAHGLTVLDHPNRDRIVVARSPSGPWIYASVTDYEPRAPGEPTTPRRDPELHQRRYDWSPPVPNAPREAEVDERLRRWQEAQAAVDLKVRGPGEAAGPAGSPALVPPLARDGKGPTFARQAPHRPAREPRAKDGLRSQPATLRLDPDACGCRSAPSSDAQPLPGPRPMNTAV
jgi:hypothetical protein